MLAIDIGYGYTKAVSKNGARVSFPSVIAPASIDILNGIYKENSGHRVRLITISGAIEKLVGEAAVQSIAAQGFVARQEKPIDLHDLLLLTAAYLCNTGDDEPLAVGLPLAFYRTQKAMLKERLTKFHARLSVDGDQTRNISFGSISVYPQGAGALVTLGPDFLKDGIVGLIDIGTYTTDYLLFNVKNRVPIPVLDACGSVEAGIYLAQRAIASEFEQQAGSPLPQRLYQWALDQARQAIGISYQGKDIQLFNAWSRVKGEIADTIASHVLATWGDRVGFLTATAFAGGGANLLYDNMKKLFPNPVYAEEGYFANAVGFLTMLGGNNT